MLGKPISVLLADDDEDDCLLFAEALEELNLSTQLTTVRDGEQLMRLLSKVAYDLPLLLFLDLNMPRKNGFECLAEIKKTIKLSHLPVIIFSTSFDRKVADQLFKNGAHHFICKPTDFHELKDVIHRAITLVSENFTNTVGNFSQPIKENFVLGK